MLLKTRSMRSLSSSVSGLFLLLSTSAFAAGQATPGDPIKPVPLANKTTSESTDAAQRRPEVVIATNMGEIAVRLNPEKAPKTVANFLSYVDSGHYKDTIFHRVISSFMIQGGGFSESMQKKPANQTVENEADNGLINELGTIAMARTSDPHSASAQFFINTQYNANLDHTSKTGPGWGYTVFGEVFRGSNVIQTIKRVPTATKGRMRDVPVEPVIIYDIKRI
ncbi:MAG: peptidyl-prolyl cis-trans isomerase B (cyclophilin B) [Pseudoalteromonas tetraodonis]|jgi:peptidyl-prolyl cis-trans isomerase B (cyclophilin B)